MPHLLPVESQSNLLHIDRTVVILVIDDTDDIRLSVDNLITGGCVITLANITIAVRGATEHIDLSLARAMPLAAAGSLEDLRPLYSAIMPWNCTNS